MENSIINITLISIQGDVIYINYNNKTNIAQLEKKIIKHSQTFFNIIYELNYFYMRPTIVQHFHFLQSSLVRSVI